MPHLINKKLGSAACRAFCIWSLRSKEKLAEEFFGYFWE